LFHIISVCLADMMTTIIIIFVFTVGTLLHKTNKKVAGS
jgi:hypothetical protein